jgi:LPXTG-motif cell wall-anchored protein
MKKIVSIMMVIVLVFTMAGIAFASTNVISPEKPNTDVEPGTPGEPSPQTGETVSIIWVAVAAVALLAIAFVCVKKLILVK